jgi:transcriptional regulator with XRE-family HTH domain
MNFYDNFLVLCERKDVAPSRALEDAGLSKALYSKWKQKPDSIPNGMTLEKLSKYFMVPIDALKGSPFSANPTGLEGMPEIEELARAASRMDLATRKNILSYAQFICPEAFNCKK